MVGHGALVVGGGSVCGDWGVLALVMVFREVMLTSPPKLAHCGGGRGSEANRSNSWGKVAFRATSNKGLGSGKCIR